VLAALHLTDPQTEALRQLSESDWRAALEFSDRARLTLVLREMARDAMPRWVRDRVDENAANWLIRRQSIEDLYRRIHGLLTCHGLEFVALKGVTHTEVAGRVQYDVDLYLPRETVTKAQEALVAAGWVSAKGMEGFPTDHLPALIRPIDWQWRGDFFDPDLPIAIELHFRFWNDETERLRAPGVDEFWTRRETSRIAGIDLSVLSPPDLLGYAALHLLKHLVRGSVNAFHVYEIARMLQARAEDEAFRTELRADHTEELRRLEAVVFRLAKEWFGCPAVEADLLPAAADAWFEEFALSPATQEFAPNKDHLWLHITLLESRTDAWRVARRRLVPGNLPPRSGTGRGGLWPGYIAYTARRFRHHAIALPHTGLSGLRFWWRVNSLGRQFWLFLASAALFNFPLFIFFLHYNLFLLDLGFREDFVGTVNSALRVGSMLGTIPAALIAHRLGLRRSLIAVVLATSAAEVMRAIAGARMPLAVLALVSGCAFAVWAVVMTPLIAAAAPEKRRATAYSVFFASMMSTGIAGSWLGGLLPSVIHSRRTVLLCAAAFSALAVLPALRLKEFPRAPVGARIYPRSRFLALYLFAFAIWHLATGTFNPFNNVYFKRLGFADQRIGSVFALAQLVQVGALLAAPLIIRRLGLLNGIVVMMAATALALGGLAMQPPEAGAVAAYIGYMSFQWMSEPGLNTLLMNRVEERERTGASALNYVVAFGAQALAAYAGGAMFSRLGYGPALAGAAALALLAAVLFGVLLRGAFERPGQNLLATDAHG
jgi:predicted MFS family arabinose efflux permease